MNSASAVKIVLLLALPMVVCFAEEMYFKTQRPLFDYILEPVNVRAVALGGTGTASATGGFSFYNPAAAAAERSFVSVDFGEQWGDLVRGSVETAWIFGKWYTGLSFFTRSVEFQLADIHGKIGGNGAVQESMVSLLGGWKNSRVAIAAAATGLPYTMYDRTSFAMTASGGVTVKVLPGSLNAGAAVLNAGRYHRGFYTSKYSAHRDSMATTVRAGVMWSPKFIAAIPIQAAADIVYTPHTEDVIVPIGLEARLLDVLSVRIGKRIGHATDIMTFGAGLAWENCSFDASFVPVSIEGDADMKWLMGLRYELPSFRKTSVGKGRPVILDTARVTPATEPVEIPLVLPGLPLPLVSEPVKQADSSFTRVNPVDSTVAGTAENTVVPPPSDTAALPKETLPVHPSAPEAVVQKPENITPDSAAVPVVPLPLPPVKDTVLQEVDSLRQP